MFVNASETPFFSLIMLCFYVLKIITPNGLKIIKLDWFYYKAYKYCAINGKRNTG
jgi:hypothetical protein